MYGYAARFYARHKKAIVGAAPVAGVAGTLFALMVVVENHERRELSDEISSSKRFLKHLLSSSNNDNYDGHAMNLETYGVTIVRNVLSSDEDPATILKWQQRVRQQCTTLDNSNNQNAASSRNTAPGTVNIHGRLHFHVAPNVPYHHELARLGGEHWEQGRRIRQVPIALTPMTRIVQDYFSGQQPKVKTNYGLTQLQLLNALPGSMHQIWHRDNTQRGITAIVALSPILHHGPTEVILSSHNQSSSALVLSSMKNYISYRNTRIGENNNTVDNDIDRTSPWTTMQHHHHLLACLEAGDAILYDSRCLHRGRGWNTSSSSSSSLLLDRPVLILRWDADGTPPPGSGMIPTTISRYGGFVLSLILYFKAYCYKLYQNGIGK